MTQQNINIGTVPNDGTGDNLRSGMTKVNSNFTDLYRGNGNFVQIGTGAVTRTVSSKLKDQGLNVTDFGAVADGTAYSTSGGTDNTAAINAALLAASTLGYTSVIFPDGPGVYNVSGKIFLQPSVYIKGTGGRPKINLTASVDYVVDSNVNTLMSFQGWDNVDILCNSLASGGFYLRYFKQFYHSNSQIEDFNQQGFIIGDPSAPGAGPDSYIFNNLQTWRNSSTIPVPSIGMWLRNSPDTLGTNSGFVGATVGMQVQSGGKFYNIHNWARASTGVMTTCFLCLNGGCTFVGCEADTPTQIGFDLTGTQYVLDSCNVFNNNGTTSTDNVVVGIKFRTSNPASSISNLICQGIDSSHRIAIDIQPNGGVLNGISIFGSSNANVVTPINLDCTPVSMQVGDNLSSSTNLTVNGANATNRQLIFDTAGSPRWIFRVSNTETGSNVGSDLSINARDDNGNGLSQPISIARNNGTITVNTSMILSGSISGTGLTNYFASPSAIGSVVANTGAFTALSASSTVSGTGFSNYLASPPAIGGTAPAAITGTNLTISNTANPLAWGTNAFLYGDAANTIEQFNGVNGQTFNLYNTFTNTSNYERLSIGWSGNSLNIQTQQAGTGVSRSIIVGTSAGNWAFDSGGAFRPTSDASLDIGLNNRHIRHSYQQGIPLNSGTNVAVPTTGQTVTVAQTTNCQICQPAGALAALTIQFPTPLSDGHCFELSITNSITTLTLTPNAGASIVGSFSSVTTYLATKYRYAASTTTWYEIV